MSQWTLLLVDAVQKGLPSALYWPDDWLTLLNGRILFLQQLVIGLGNKEKHQIHYQRFCWEMLCNLATILNSNWKHGNCHVNGITVLCALPQNAWITSVFALMCVFYLCLHEKLKVHLCLVYLLSLIVSDCLTRSLCCWSPNSKIFLVCKSKALPIFEDSNLLSLCLRVKFLLQRNIVQFLHQACVFDLPALTVPPFYVSVSKLRRK